MKVRTIMYTLIMGIALGSAANGQTTSVFTTGLTLPNKIINAGENSMLVSEAGTPVANTGRISLIDRSTGTRKTLIGGLPSGVNNLGGSAASSGPSGMKLQGHTLYVTVATGDAVQNIGGVELPNPNTPSSPLYDSVLELNLPGDYEDVTSPFTLAFSDQTAMAAGGTVTLTNLDGQELEIRMIADFPNYSFPKASNIFGVELFQKHLYVIDAAFNLVYKVNIKSGTFVTFTTFAQKSNPSFPFGPPMVDAVPDSIHRVGNMLNITLLTGFPFAPGVAEVRQVSLKDGSQSTLIPGLRSAIDSLHLENEDGTSSYYTLEFSANQLGIPNPPNPNIPVPGVLKYFATADAAPVVVNTTNPAAPFLFTTSMARDAATGDIFVTNIFLGRITRVQF